MKKLLVFTDGGSRGNPGPAAIGAIVKPETGQDLAKISRKIGVSTNNVAEYRAVIESLLYVKNNDTIKNSDFKEIQFYLDSRLVVNQLNGLFRVKDGNLQELLFEIKKLEQEIKIPIYYNLIPRERNREADTLVNLALDQN